MNKIYLESNRTMVDFVTFVRKTSIICLSKEIWAKLHFSLESTNIRFSEIFGLNNTENNFEIIYVSLAKIILIWIVQVIIYI